MSVMDSLCSSRTSDRVILLPLLGTSNTRIAPDETPRKREKETLDCRVLYFGYSYKYTSLCTYPHIYNSPTLPISLEQTRPELGHKTSSVNAQDFGMKLWNNTFLSHMNMCTNVRAMGKQNHTCLWVNLTKRKNNAHVNNVLTDIWDYVALIMWVVMPGDHLLHYNHQVLPLMFLIMFVSWGWIKCTDTFPGKKNKVCLRHILSYITLLILL